jgi:tRNA (adenine22-N1)-methyltransferase
VIATEARAGPLARLRERIAGIGVECRGGEGLAPIRPGEVEVAVLAGMGGRRMARVLAAAPDVVARLELLVLQPMQNVAELRAWLDQASLDIDLEAEVVQGRRRYTLLLVRGRASGTG